MLDVLGYELVYLLVGYSRCHHDTRNRVVTSLYQSLRFTGLTCRKLKSSRVWRIGAAMPLTYLWEATGCPYFDFLFCFTFVQHVSYWFLKISLVSLFRRMDRSRCGAAGGDAPRPADRAPAWGRSQPRGRVRAAGSSYSEGNSSPGTTRGSTALGSGQTYAA